MVVVARAEGAAEVETALREAGENPIRIGEIIETGGAERVLMRGTLAL